MKVFEFRTTVKKCESVLLSDPGGCSEGENYFTLPERISSGSGRVYRDGLIPTLLLSADKILFAAKIPMACV